MRKQADFLSRTPFLVLAAVLMTGLVGTFACAPKTTPDASAAASPSVVASAEATAEPTPPPTPAYVGPVAAMFKGIYRLNDAGADIVSPI